MNIKEVERITGISSQNIRFYEKKGLITPKRNKLNTYREYGEEEIRRLKLIKMFRMLDMSIEQIALLLDGKKILSVSLKEQQQLLERKMIEMKSVLQFCEQLEKSNVTLQNLNVDDCLNQMEQKKSSFFTKWITDYKDVVQYEHERRFTFIPDDAITNRYEFANALYAFAMEKDLDLVITKECMYPEFTINGIEYTAERNYARGGGIPIAVISCTRKDAPEVEAEFKHGKKKWMRILHIAWPGIFLFLFFLITRWKDGFQKMLRSPEGWIILAVLAVICVVGIIRNYYLYWNRDSEYEDKN
ncbi:MAG: MerR family transcriptional regulator [Hespellia sp.]|nr:MerR family transcriptional regulator [Hespellia sp.]